MPEGYNSVVPDKKGLYSADVSYDAEFERWMHVPESDAYGKGPGGRYAGRTMKSEPGDVRKGPVVYSAEGKFKGYIDERTGELAPYNERLPTWLIERGKALLKDPWYLTVRDCGLKVGLRAAAGRCRSAGSRSTSKRRSLGR